VWRFVDYWPTCAALRRGMQSSAARDRCGRAAAKVTRGKVAIAGCLAMAALRSRCGHYILQLWFLSFFFFLLFFLAYSQRSHFSAHAVALVRI